jgi:ribosomal protein S18 acetylase RimI-like enzyme
MGGADGDMNDASAQALTSAIEANLLHHARVVATRLPQVELHDESDALWSATRIRDPYLNRVYWARFSREDADRRVGEILTHFVSRELPLSWHIGPSSEPPDLGTLLVSRGLIRLKDEIGMALDLSTLGQGVPAPSGLAIEAVAGKSALRSWVEVVAAGFEFPDSVATLLFELHRDIGSGEHLPWRLFLGVTDGEPVGTSRLFVSGGLAGIYHVATQPRERERGFGTAMTLAALREARKLGCEIAVLRAAQMALGLYNRLGFQERCKFGRYLWRCEKGVD